MKKLAIAIALCTISVTACMGGNGGNPIEAAPKEEVKAEERVEKEEQDKVESKEDAEESKMKQEKEAEKEEAKTEEAIQEETPEEEINEEEIVTFTDEEVKASVLGLLQGKRDTYFMLFRFAKFKAPLEEKQDETEVRVGDLMQIRSFTLYKELKDVEWVKRLKNLEEITLININNRLPKEFVNKLMEVVPAAKITEIGLGNVEMDLGELERFEKVERFVIDGNGVMITKGKFPELRGIHTRAVEIKDISGLKNLPKFEEFDFRYQGKDKEYSIDLSVIPDNVKMIRLESIPVLDTKQFLKRKDMTSISLRNVPINNQSLADLPARFVSLKEVDITELKYLNPKVEGIYVDDLVISDLEVLGTMPNIKNLNITLDDQIEEERRFITEDIAKIKEMKNLLYVDLNLTSGKNKDLKEGLEEKLETELKEALPDARVYVSVF